MSSLWNPDEQSIKNTQLSHFIAYVNQRHSLKFSLTDYPPLHLWSVKYPDLFWEAVFSFCRIYSSNPPQKIIELGKTMRETRWFADAKLNFAQNLLRFRDEKTAIIFTSERGDRESMSYAELFAKVSILALYLTNLGLNPGDRGVGFLPNCPATIIAMLATTSLGGIWSACSSDFGLDGLLSRFSQIEPKFLFAVDGHFYNGKTFNHLEKIKTLEQALPSLVHTIVVPFILEHPEISHLNQASLLTELWKNLSTPPALEFTQLPFDHPIYILYSSGTTGKPKCMVHGAGGTLIQHLKELVLHTNLRREDRFFFYTTCTWMMWHWMVSGLAVGATLVIYEGSPAYPRPTQLFDLIDQEKINVCGLGAKLLEFAQNEKIYPIKTHSLLSLRTILTTGSPLLPESFDYVYGSIKQDVHLASISGGSDIISCFALGNPNLPVYRGELQCKGLGMDVQVFNHQGESTVGEKGELVCASAFPSMPVYFWNDPAGEKYHQAYFDQFPHVWTHGDYAMITEHHGLIIYGRSDATLKPSGVRIGTAEIYQELEAFKEIYDSVAVGKQTPEGEIIVLFITLAPGIELDEQLVKNIKQRIRTNASPMHVPAKIIHAPDIPKTINNKTMELAVKKLINGELIENIEVIANPECLEFYKRCII